MQNPAPLPEDLIRGPFDRRAADRAGVRQGRLRARDLLRPYSGVHTTQAPGTPEERCRAYAVRLKPGQAFSHATAAVLLGLPLPRMHEEDAQLHVAAVMPAPAPTTRGVVGHRLRVPPPMVALRGLPIVRADEVWAQLGAVLPLDDLIVLGDAVVHSAKEQGPAALEALRVAASKPYRTGAVRLRRALREIRIGSASPGETRVRLLLTRAGAPEPLLNGPVTARDGRRLGTGDLTWPERRAVLEYEGDGHRVDRGQFRYDIDRYGQFRDAEWTVFRTTADDLVGSRATALVRRVRAVVG